MPSVKQYRDYDDLIALLVERGMNIGGREGAIRELRRVSYYRLSGYWYPFRKLENAARQDDFYPGTTLVAVLDLYRFDQGLRSMTFAALGNIELAVRASLGHERMLPLPHPPRGRHCGSPRVMAAGNRIDECSR